MHEVLVKKGVGVAFLSQEEHDRNLELVLHRLYKWDACGSNKGAIKEIACCFLGI